MSDLCLFCQSTEVDIRPDARTLFCHDCGAEWPDGAEVKDLLATAREEGRRERDHEVEMLRGERDAAHRNMTLTFEEFQAQMTLSHEVISEIIKEECFKKGRREGQEAMRERCAAIAEAESCFDPECHCALCEGTRNIAREIRALEVE